MSEETASVEQSAGSTHDVSLDQPAEQDSSGSNVGQDTNGQDTNGRKSSAAEGAPKKSSAYYKIRQANRALKAERDQFQRERQAFMQEREQAQKPKRDYTLKDLTSARAAWAAEAEAEWDQAKQQAKLDLVAAADKEIKAIKAEEEAVKAASNRTVQVPVMGTPEHKAEWESAERELAQADPEFMREGTALDTKLREIMAGPDGNIYRQHPRGIVAAYHRAKMDLLSAENSKLKDELKRYRGLTSIGGGAPSRVGTGGRVESVSDFARLSLKDQRKHLLSGADKNGVPWF